MQNQFNLAVVTVNKFLKAGGKEVFDTNGNQTVILSPVAGKIPNKNVVAGTVAINSGLEIKHTYLVQVIERETNEYGRQFSFQVISEVANPLDIIKAMNDLGAGQVITVTDDQEVEAEVISTRREMKN